MGVIRIKCKKLLLARAFLHFIENARTLSINWLSFVFGYQIQLGYAEHNTSSPLKRGLKFVEQPNLMKISFLLP